MASFMLVRMTTGCMRLMRRRVKSTGATLPAGALTPRRRWQGVVYVGSHDHTFYALSAQAGEKLWSFTTGGSIVSSPVEADEVVYVGSNDHNLYAFNQTVLLQK